MNDPLETRAAKALSQLQNEAFAQATLQTVLEIASQVGVTEIQGLLPKDFHEVLRIQIVERRLPLHADRDMALVSAMQKIWEKLRSKRI